MHPWLAIINGVQQENKKIEVVKKGEKDKGKEDKVEENNETNAEADNKEEKQVGEDKDNEQQEKENTSDNNCSQRPKTLSRPCSAVNIVPWPLMENKEEQIKHDGKIKKD